MNKKSEKIVNIYEFTQRYLAEDYEICEEELNFTILIDRAFTKIEENFNQAYPDDSAENPIDLQTKDFHSWMFQDPEVIVLTGNPRTAIRAGVRFALEVSSAIRKFPVFVFCSHFSPIQLATDMISMVSGVGTFRLHTGLLKDVHWPRLLRAAGILTQQKWLFVQAGIPDAEEIHEVLRSCKRSEDSGLIIVDSIEIMEQQGSSEDRLENGGMEQLASDLGLPVIGISHKASAGEESDAADMVVDFLQKDYNSSDGNRGMEHAQLTNSNPGKAARAFLRFLEQDGRSS
ncbi:DnaB-like helicase C-terminal domain-containing protein [Thermodesulfobacteriota bacterium]